MNTTDPEKEQEQSHLPDFVEDDKQTTGFGETEHPEVEQESFPSNGSQTQTGAATNNSKSDTLFNEDGDDSLAKTDD